MTLVYSTLCVLMRCGTLTLSIHDLLPHDRQQLSAEMAISINNGRATIHSWVLTSSTIENKCPAWVMHRDLHRQHSALLAVRCYDSTVLVYGVLRKTNRPFDVAIIKMEKRADPI